MSAPEGYSHIYAAVRRIPMGHVATYGQIAQLAGIPGHARQVGYALHALSEEHDVPWHRVINAFGRVSKRSDTEHDDLQRVLLEAEGIEFDVTDRVLFEKFRWNPELDRTDPVLGDRSE